MECAFNNVYTTKFGIVEQCTQNCGGDSGGGGGGVDMMMMIIIAVSITLALVFCGYAYYRTKRGKAVEDVDKPLPPSSQDADKGKVHSFDQSDKTARTEISGKVRTAANSTASVKNGILETNLLQLLVPQCSPIRVARKRHRTW
jgi:hypothetical protein